MEIGHAHELHVWEYLVSAKNTHNGNVFCLTTALRILAGLVVLAGLFACSTASRLKPAFDVTYVQYAAAETAPLLSDTANNLTQCESTRPNPESMLARSFSRRTVQSATLLSTTDVKCKTTAMVPAGGDMIVVARQNDWLFVLEPTTNKEGWISASFMKYGFNSPSWGKVKQCLDMEWSESGIRVKNVCDRDISDMWICFAKNDRSSCSTNWNQIGRLDAGKTDVLRKMPRHTSGTWFAKVCLEPGKVDTGAYANYCNWQTTALS